MNCDFGNCFVSTHTHNSISIFLASGGVLEEEDGASDELGILSKEPEKWFGRWSKRPKNDAIVYYPSPNVCVDVNALHFHITVCLCEQLWKPLTRYIPGGRLHISLAIFVFYCSKLSAYVLMRHDFMLGVNL